MLKRLFSSWTSRIILLNVLFFIFASIAMAFYSQEIVFDFIALKPLLFLQGNNLWTLLTSMFMHASVIHLFFNMFSLFFIGMFAEKIIGRKRFLVFYLIAGLFAGLFFALLSGFFGDSLLGGRLFGVPEIYGVGASGAIFGLVGLIAVLTPKNKVYLILGPLIAIILEVILGSFITSEGLLTILSLLVNVYLIISIFFMFSFNPRKRRIAIPVEMPFWILPIVSIVPLVIVSLFIELPIGNSAHLGGLIAGLIYGYYLKIKYPKKTAFIARYFSK